MTCFRWLIQLGIYALLIATVTAQEPDPVQRKLAVGTRHVPPFSIKNADGTWDGLSIELWRTIATDNNWDFDLREMKLAEMLKAVANHELDAGVGAITVTAEREKLVDFTHPFYSSGLGVAIRKTSGRAWAGGMLLMLAWEFGTLLVIFAALTLAFGGIIWLLERKHNADHFGYGWEGLGHGIWWAVVTMTTVGYGDKAPKTVLGRGVAIFWMFVGVISLAVVTGSVASKMTAARLGTTIRSPEDLRHIRTGTITGTTSEAFLLSEGIVFRGYAMEMAALQGLERREVDAVVFDAPTLRYVIQHESIGACEVLPTRFRRQDYAIALPPGSPLREPINQSLTRIVFDPRWEKVTRRYLGR